MSHRDPTTHVSAATYRRRRLAVGTAALLVVGATLWGFGWTLVTAFKPLPAAAVEITVPPTLTQPAADLDMPATGRAALGASGFDGVIAHSGDQGQAPIASITKVVTALVVLAAKPIEGEGAGPTITYSSEDVQIWSQVVAQNGSNAPVSDGLQLSERDSLTVMLLPSANNYAMSLAIWAFGSEDAFVAAASDWLKQHNLNNTRIVEPTGLSASNVASPSDLVQLAKLAEENTVVASIVARERAEIPGVGTVQNTNTLLGDSGIIGVKTGTTDEAGSCLLFAAKFAVGEHQVLLVGALLGGASHESVDAAVLAMVESAERAFVEVPLTSVGGTVGAMRTAWGQSTSVQAASGSSLIAFSDIPVETSTRFDARSTLEASTTVGTLTAHTGTQEISVELFATEGLTDPGPWWRLTHSGELP